MSVQIALDDKTNDLIMLSNGRGIARVSEGRYTIQLVKNKLLTELGEWLLDTSLGWVNSSDMEKNKDLFELEVRAKRIILGTVGVQQIDTFEMVFEERKLTITFTAKTIYGIIDLTVPWSL